MYSNYINWYVRQTKCDLSYFIGNNCNFNYVQNLTKVDVRYNKLCKYRMKEIFGYSTNTKEIDKPYI